MCAIVKNTRVLPLVCALPPSDEAGVYQGVATGRGNRRQREPERQLVTRVLSVCMWRGVNDETSELAGVRTTLGSKYINDTLCCNL